jgi:phosphatidylserine/phosphatidylglycerophosphate/cardiolipin synthase-like enzyme
MMNFDNRSLALYDEAMLMTLDSAAGKRMEEVLNEDLRYASQVDLASFSKRSHFERMKEWAANLITRVSSRLRTRRGDQLLPHSNRGPKSSSIDVRAVLLAIEV